MYATADDTYSYSLLPGKKFNEEGALGWAPSAGTNFKQNQRLLASFETKHIIVLISNLPI